MYWIIGLLGITSFASPWLFGYSDQMLALWISLGLGAGLVALSVLEWVAADRDTWEYWIAGLAGIVLAASPFVFGYTGSSGALWTSLVVGVLTLFVSGSRLLARPLQQ